MMRGMWLTFLIVFLMPLATHAAYWTARGGPPSWREADWSSSGVLPAPASNAEAAVYVMAARSGRWKGIFAHHSWLVVKPAGAANYTRYDVVGWGSPVRTNNYQPDGKWFSNTPQIAAMLRGREAQAAIPRIRKAVSDYPFAARGDYRIWPGPNSNSFVAYVVRAVPELAGGLLPTALGKDFNPLEGIVGPVPSRTGWQVSWRGLIGLSLGWVEGLEINLFGLVAGIDLRRPAIKLPGWGRIGMAAD